VKQLFRKIKWIFQGKPMKEYEGYHCGCCGNWNGEPFKIPDYLSYGKWWDTWELCDKCIQGAKAVKASDE
jgi:hypothetical protein